MGQNQAEVILHDGAISSDLTLTPKDAINYNSAYLLVDVTALVGTLDISARILSAAYAGGVKAFGTLTQIVAPGEFVYIIGSDRDTSSTNDVIIAPIPRAFDLFFDITTSATLKVGWQPIIPVGA